MEKDIDHKTQEAPETTRGNKNPVPKTQKQPETIRGENPKNQKTVERGDGVKVN